MQIISSSFTKFLSKNIRMQIRMLTLNVWRHMYKYILTANRNFGDSLDPCRSCNLGCIVETQKRLTLTLTPPARLFSNLRNYLPKISSWILVYCLSASGLVRVSANISSVGQCWILYFFSMKSSCTIRNLTSKYFVRPRELLSVIKAIVDILSCITVERELISTILMPILVKKFWR